MEHTLPCLPSSPASPGIARRGPSTAGWEPAGSLYSPVAATVERTFPKGQALADWLDHIRATPAVGSLTIDEAYALLSKVVAPSQRWVYASTGALTYSFDTPVGEPPAARCGRVLYSSFHVAAKGVGTTYPAECAPTALTQQEKALEFLLFDLGSCI